MVVKYKSCNANWCYKYVEDKDIFGASVVVSRLLVGDVIKSIPHANSIEIVVDSAENFKYISTCESNIAIYIREQMKLNDMDKLIFVVGETPINELDRITVISFVDGSPAMIINKEAYLMTDDGKTIERLYY